jgi:beta-barrel assembly-enhancing protease
LAEFAARYYDGKTASRRDVILRFGSDDLQVFDNGSIVDRWQFNTLGLVPETFHSTTTRLMRGGDDPARLLIEDPEFRVELFRRCPGIAAANSPRAKLLRFGVWALAVAAVILAGVGAVQYLPSVGARLVPQSWEERVGKRAADQIVDLLTAGKEGSGRCVSVEGKAALDRMAAKLSSVIDTPYDLHVIVADIAIPNAFAFPGGRIVVFRGLFDLADTPDGVAGVLAHEFAHVVHQHPTQAMLRAHGLSLGLDLLTGNMAGGDVVAGMGKLIIGASYSRDAEAEADRDAVKYLRAANISTQGLAAFFRAMAKKETALSGKLGAVLEAISSHPRTALRAEAVGGTNDAALPPVLSDREWRNLKAICGGG